MPVRYTKEQKNKLYTVALDVLSTYDVSNPLVARFIDKILENTLISNKKLVEVGQQTSTPIVKSFISQLKKQSQDTLNPIFKAAIKEVTNSLFTSAITRLQPTNKLSSFLSNIQPLLTPNSMLADIEGSSQALDLIRTGTKEQQIYRTGSTDQQTPNSALADIKGSSQALDLIRESELESKCIIDGVTDNGKKDLKDTLKGVLQCVCEEKSPQQTLTPPSVNQTTPRESQQQKPNSTGVFDKILLGVAVAAAVAEALKRMLGSKPVPVPKAPVEVPKPAPVPKAPVEVPKPAPAPAPKAPVEVPKPAPVPKAPVEAPKPAPAPKAPVEVPKPAPAPKAPVEVPKPAPAPKAPVEAPAPAPKAPVEVPKPAPAPKAPKLDEVIPKIKVPAPKVPVEAPKPIPAFKTPVEAPKPIPAFKTPVEAPKPIPAPKTPVEAPKSVPVPKAPKLDEVIPKIKVPTPNVPVPKKAGEYGAKTAAKVAGKKIPFGMGALIATALAAERAGAGDWTGAGLELASGAASVIPVAGTATSLAIDAAIMARDTQNSSSPEPFQQENNKEIPAPKPQPLPAPKVSVETPKPVSVEAPKPQPLPAPKVFVETPKPVISFEEAEQIRKNVEDQVKNLNTDPKYLLASTEPKGIVSSVQKVASKPDKLISNVTDKLQGQTNDKESSSKTVESLALVKVAGLTDNTKKQISDILLPPLKEIANKLTHTTPTTTAAREEKPSTFTSKLLDALPQNKLTSTLKLANSFKEDFEGTKEKVKQSVQNKILGKVNDVFSKKALNVASPVSRGVTAGLEKKALNVLGKTGGKSVLKKIPGVGALAGLGFAVNRLLSGDISGAGLELASGAASTIPGFGTVGSVGLDALLAAKDTQPSQTRVEQVGDAAKITDSNINPDGGLVIKSPRENSLFKPIQLSKNDGFIAAPFAKESKVNTQGTANAKDMQLPVLQNILKGTEGNNEYLARLADAIFNLARNVNNNPAPSVQPQIVMQQNSLATSQRSAAQIANANVDPIRMIRSKFNV